MMANAPQTPAFMQRFDSMWPDAYRRIYPHVRYQVDGLDDSELAALTPADAENMVQEAMKRSGVVNDPPAGHTQETLADMTRALMGRDLLDRRRRFRNYPFFFPFLFDGFRDGYRDGYRDHDRRF